LKNQSKNKYTKVGWLLFYLYIILLFYFLFFSEQFGREQSANYRYNLEFFKEIKRYFNYRERVGFIYFTVNIIGNVLAFVPFGFLVPLLKKANWKDNSFAMKKKILNFFSITFSSMFFSLCIELIQLAFKVGIFDVDDILMNTVGGILGYLLFVIGNGFTSLVRSAKHKRRKK
jgi:glycopeptide antibiotics resistance protein